MTILSTWETAARPDIRVHRVPWPALSLFTHSIRDLREYAETPLVTDAMRAVWNAHRVMTSTPLNPRDETTGVSKLAKSLEEFIADHPVHSATPRLTRLAAAARDLEAEASPIGRWLADVLPEYGASSDGSAEVAVVVPRMSWMEAVRGWLALEEFNCVDLVIPAQLRDSNNYLAVIVLGHPATTYATAFRPAESAVREYGWLLTAPPATTVRLTLIEDAPNIKSDDLWVLLPREAHPPLSFNDPGPVNPQLTEIPDPATMLTWLYPSDSPVPTLPATHIDDRDAVAATPVVTASGHTLYFDRHAGPYPLLVLLEEGGGVTVELTSMPRLIQGCLIAVHLDSAGRSELEARADAWLNSNRAWSTGRIKAARDGSQALKEILAWGLAQYGSDHIEQALIARGLTTGYARSLLHRVLGLTYIAPQPRGFNTLLETLAALPNVQQDLVARVRATSQDLVILRAAHQRAGDLLRTELRTELSTHSWEHDLRDQGWAIIRNNALGVLLLTIVLKVEEYTTNVPRTWLAQPVDSTGSRTTSSHFTRGLT